MRVIDLLMEQELIKAKYFTETEQGFIIEVDDEDDTELLSEQICKHYDEVSNALKRYLEIEDILNASYANTVIHVMGYHFSVATGIKLLRELKQVERDPITGKIIIETHPLGVFLSLCSTPCKFTYSSKSRKYLDPLKLQENIIIEDVCFKEDEFLIQLKYAIEKSNNEIEVEEPC